jgi:prepilin-type N-terminal cleavage/methylation domain-containing protein
MNRRGFSLVELVAVLALLGTLLTVAAPPLLRISGGLRVRLAADELVGVLRLARVYAVRHNANVAVKFRTEKNGAVTFTLYRDGDGDGVLTKDIDKGVDPAVGPPQRLSNFGRGVGFGFPPGPPPTDPGSPGKPLSGLGDPIRFNTSDLASFDPIGTSTPGTLYFTDGQRRLAAVRVFNRTGKVRVLIYDPETRVWRE